MSSWGEKAAHVIAEALKHCEEMGLTGKDRVAYVDAQYPFGMRRYHPYKMWLKARKEMVPELRVPSKSAQRRYYEMLAERGQMTIGQAGNEVIERVRGTEDGTR